MPTPQAILTFALVSAGIMLIPGPSNFFLLAQGIGHGRRAAMAAVIGITAASALRVLMTAAGLSALLASSPAAYTIVRWAGAGYLAYVAVKGFRPRPTTTSQTIRTAAEPRPGQSLRKGLLIGLGNPKMIIFFVAFFPQFVDPARGSQALQILVLGSIFWTIGALWDLSFA